MLKKEQKVVINNRGTKELGIVERAYRRKEILYYDVKVERGITFEGLTEDRSFPVYVELELSKKLNNQKLKPCTN